MSGGSEWRAALDPGTGAGLEEVVVDVESLELVLDFCRSRKVTLD